MKTVLPKAIKNPFEAAKFLRALYNNKESFHPEDRAENVAWDLPKDQIPTAGEKKQLNKLMQDIYNLPGNENPQKMFFDPAHFLLNLDPDYRKQAEVKEMDIVEYADKDLKYASKRFIVTKIFRQEKAAMLLSIEDLGKGLHVKIPDVSIDDIYLSDVFTYLITFRLKNGRDQLVKIPAATLDDAFYTAIWYLSLRNITVTASDITMVQRVDDPGVESEAGIVFVQ